MHTFHQASEHVYWLSPDSTTDRPLLGVVTGARGSLIVDAGASPAHAQVLLDHIAAANLSPPRYLVITHWHWDHWFGSAAFELPVIAQVATQRILAAQTTWDWSDAALDQRVAAGAEIAFCRDMLKAELPDRSHLALRAPDLAFTGEVVIDLGSVTARLLHVGGDHAADSIVVHTPEDRVVFLGDCRYEELHHTPPRYTVAQALPLFDRLVGLGASLYFGGHEPAPIPRATLEAEAALMRLVGETVARRGADRAAVLADLRRHPGRAPDDEVLRLVDLFLGGVAAGAAP